MTKKISITSLLIAGLVAPILAFAWNGPTQTPPAGNVDAPLNVSGTGQVKEGGIVFGNNSGVTNGLLVRYGNVGVGNMTPSYKLDVTGDVRASAFFYASDKSLKSNISPITNALANIKKLQGVSFTWKNNGDRALGLVAQDVEKVYPELVSTNNEGVKSVQYGNLVAPLIEAIKEQQKQIDALKAEIEALKAGN